MHFGRYDYAAFSAFLVYAAGSLAIPIALVNIADDLHFPLAEGGLSAGGLLSFARTIPMILTMLICGFLAGHLGKRKSLGLSVAVMSLGIFLCAFAPQYALLFLALAIAGLGEGIIEGLATPFIQNLHEHDQPGRYINFAHGFWSVGVFFTVTIAGLLLTLGVHWRIILAFIALLGLIPTALFLLPQTHKNPYPESTEPYHPKTIINHAKRIVKVPRFWLYFAAMFLAGGGEFGLTFWAASYIQLNFTTTALAGGLGTTCFAGGMILGRTGFGFYLKQHQLPNLITITAALAVIITLLLPYTNSLLPFMLVLFFAGIAAAPHWPSIQSYATDRLPHLNTTMIFILLSCAGIPGCGTVTYLIGYIGSLTGSLHTAFLIIPLCFLIVTLLIGIDWLFLSPKDLTHRTPEPQIKNPPLA
ncbi:putative transporter [Poriferisphaera corsica]|uniref:Putative transporter n=2 Tax=Poriferisphaera corsica TaxID=2528020 RepID=A0A517YWJ1_9BACT|nr:putative transporter [Poriferisphaera corsica]